MPMSCDQTATTNHSPHNGCPCVNRVHAHPLPLGQVASAEVAYDRLNLGWDNPACPDCGHHGWLTP